MSGRSVSRGTCVFCAKDYAKSGMSRHLQACEARKAAIAAEGKPKTRLFHLSVEGTYAIDYWMHLEVPAIATLQRLDQFLRDIWLECCGHLSMFDIGGIRYQCMAFDDGWWGSDDPDMSAKLGAVLTPGLKFTHRYDFGSTTYLTLKVIAERQGARSKGEWVRILARNDTPDYRCERCGKPAVVVDVFEDYTLLCEECAEREADEEGLMPLVNSPRVGVCGYVGDAWG